MDTIWQLLLFGGLIYLMMRFGCGAHMFGHGSKDKKDAHAGGHGGCCGGGGGKHADASAGGGQHQRMPPKMDTDPVCGKTVSTEKAKTTVHGGLVYFFCSPQCREAFEAAPHNYVDGGQPDKVKRLEHTHV